MMVDLARQMRDTNLNWPYAVGDHFCTSLGQMETCLEIDQSNGDVWLRSHNGRFPLKDVAWLPKRTQALDWLQEHGWRINVHGDEKSARVQAVNAHSHGSPVLEAIGHNELEAIYDTMLQILDGD